VYEKGASRVGGAGNVHGNVLRGRYGKQEGKGGDGVKFNHTHVGIKKKRNCGCSSVITISTPKYTLNTKQG